MKKKLLLGLFTVSTLLLLNNVYAYECQYSEGGIPCCKKYGKTKVPSGKVVEKTCDFLFQVQHALMKINNGLIVEQLKKSLQVVKGGVLKPKNDVLN